MNWEKRILHLGLGRFHRAHQAVYYQKLASLGDFRWGVVSMSMRSPEARDHMKEVNLRYPVVETGEKKQDVTWIESIREVYAASEEFTSVIYAFTRAELEIITLTITEKGYDLSPQGKLDFTNEQIQKDLNYPDTPHSAIGILAKGLQERRKLKLDGVTVISCDNLRENGSKLKNAVYDYLTKLNWSDDLNWIKSHVTFPNTMVDRIVPALKDDKISEFETNLKLPTNSQVIATEEFSQWVIEDQFVKPRPPLEKVGVEFVSDVRPYEEIKLKLLNASHSYLAYAGLNRGYQFVHEAIRDEELRKNVLNLYGEVTPTLDIPKDFDVKDYQNKLIRRFENNRLPHQLKQIAMDGSQKLPQRIFPSLIKAYAENRPHEILTTALKEWVAFCWNTSKSGNVLEDPIGKIVQTFSVSEERDWKKQFLSQDIFTELRNKAIYLALF